MRCGERKVFVVFRKGLRNIREVNEEVEMDNEEKCEFIKFKKKKKVIIYENRIVEIEF